jgi:hypothetical protein
MTLPDLNGFQKRPRHQPFLIKNLDYMRKKRCPKKGNDSKESAGLSTGREMVYDIVEIYCIEI